MPSDATSDVIVELGLKVTQLQIAIEYLKTENYRRYKEVVALTEILDRLTAPANVPK
jgi:hypothetical protein